MSDRYYAESEFDGPIVKLCPSESHHLAQVLRAQVGDSVTLFNGRGSEATAEIEQLSRKTVRLRVMDVTAEPAIKPLITLATAIPKGDRFRWLVEKAAELGVARLIPLVTARSVVKPGAGKLDKMRQTAVAAAKQCGSRYLLQIEEAMSWSEFVDAQHENPSVYVAHPGGDSLPGALPEADADFPVVLVIGPEGGFTDGETAEAVQRGARLVSLGANLLRIETAAVAFAAFWRLCGGNEFRFGGTSS